MNEKTVGMLSKFTGVSVHTIKYYEKLGLISSSRREQSNYRSYDVKSCTDIYECMKYRNMGFSLKDIQLLLKEGDNALLSSLLEKRSQELATEVTELLNTRELIENYRKELADLDRRLGKWYIEDCPDFYFRRQTKGLNYMDEASCESDGTGLSQAATHLGRMFGLGGVPLVTGEALYYLGSYAVTFIIAIIGATPYPARLMQRLSGGKRTGRVLSVAAPVVLAVLLAVITDYLVDGSFNPVLYFRF